MKKIYTKVIIDTESGKTVYEDSYLYSGPMALCQEGGEGGDEGGDEGGGDDGGGGDSPTILTLGDILPEDIRGDNLPGSLKDFAAVQFPGKDADEEAVTAFHGKIGSLAKSYADTKSMVGGMVKIPGKDAKPEEVAAFRTKIGVPEKVEDYEIENPSFDDTDKAVFSDELLEEFTKAAHEVGFTPTQLQAAVDFQAEMIRRQITDMDKAAEVGTEELQKELGDDYDGLMEGAELVVSKYFSDEAKEKIKQYGIGNDPDFVRGLMTIYKATKEAGDPKGLKDGKDIDATVEGIQSEIDNLMNSKEYQNGDKATHEKVAKLFEKKQKAMGTYKKDVRSSKVEV